MLCMKYAEEMAHATPKDSSYSSCLCGIIIGDYSPRCNAVVGHSLTKEVGSHSRNARVRNAVAHDNSAVIGVTHDDRHEVIAILVCVVRRVKPNEFVTILLLKTDDG